MITRINEYSLGQDITTFPGLREFTNLEYKAFALAGAARNLSEEKIFDGGSIEFADTKWDLMIGTSKNKVYKISLGKLEPDSDSAKYIFNKTLQYLIAEMGEPSQWLNNNMRAFWDGKDGGNVLLGKVSRMGKHGVDINITAPFNNTQQQYAVARLKNYNYLKIFFVFIMINEIWLTLGYFNNSLFAQVVDKPSLIKFLLINQSPVVLWAIIFSLAFLVLKSLITKVSKKISFRR